MICIVQSLKLLLLVCSCQCLELLPCKTQKASNKMLNLRMKFQVKLTWGITLNFQQHQFFLISKILRKYHLYATKTLNIIETIINTCPLSSYFCYTWHLFLGLWYKLRFILIFLMIFHYFSHFVASKTFFSYISSVLLSSLQLGY